MVVNNSEKSNFYVFNNIQNEFKTNIIYNDNLNINNELNNK